MGFAGFLPSISNLPNNGWQGIDIINHKTPSRAVATRRFLNRIDTIDTVYVLLSVSYRVRGLLYPPPTNSCPPRVSLVKCRSVLWYPRWTGCRCRPGLGVISQDDHLSKQYGTTVTHSATRISLRASTDRPTTYTYSSRTTRNSVGTTTGSYLRISS